MQKHIAKKQFCMFSFILSPRAGLKPSKVSRLVSRLNQDAGEEEGEVGHRHLRHYRHHRHRRHHRLHRLRRLRHLCHYHRNPVLRREPAF